MKKILVLLVAIVFAISMGTAVATEPDPGVDVNVVTGATAGIDYHPTSIDNSNSLNPQAGVPGLPVAPHVQPENGIKWKVFSDPYMKAVTMNELKSMTKTIPRSLWRKKIVTRVTVIDDGYKKNKVFGVVFFTNGEAEEVLNGKKGLVRVAIGKSILRDDTIPLEAAIADCVEKTSNSDGKPTHVIVLVKTKKIVHASLRVFGSGGHLGSLTGSNTGTAGAAGSGIGSTQTENIEAQIVKVYGFRQYSTFTSADFHLGVRRSAKEVKVNR